MKVTVKMIEFGTTIQNQSGGSYNGTLITYTNNGKVMTKGIATKFIDSPQQAELKGKLEKLAKELPKDVVFITTETEYQGRKFTNFVDVLEADAEDVSVRSGNNTTNRTGNQQHSSTYRSGNVSNTSERGNNSLKDVTIARSVGIKAAVDMGITDLTQVLDYASKIAAYIVQPLGIDVNGTKVTVNGDPNGNGNTNL